MSDFHTISSTKDGVTMTWDVETIWDYTKDFPVVEWEIPQSFLDSWSWGEEHLSEHLDRTLDADLKYPIILWNGVIMDGCHRVCKAIALGQSSIAARHIINMPHPREKTESKGVEPKPPRFTHRDMVEIVKTIAQREREYEYKYRHPADGI